MKTLANDPAVTLARVTIVRTERDVKHLLVGALEGGSHYWCEVMGERYAEGITAPDFWDSRKMAIPGIAVGRFCDPGDYYHPWQLIPLVEGCSLLLAVEDDQDGVNEWAPAGGRPRGDRRSYRTLTREKLVRGVEIMADVMPKAFADWLTGDDDAGTADVFLQCAVLPDEVLRDRDAIFG